MRIVTFSQASTSLSAVLDAVIEDADVTVITRRDGANAVVMSINHYQSIMERVNLRSTRSNAADLATPISQYGKTHSV